MIGHIPQKELTWRSHQRAGSIMKPSTFRAIEKKAIKEYHIGPERAKKVAGAAYWNTAQAKYKAR